MTSTTIEQEKPVKSSYLLFPPQGMLLSKSQNKKKSWLRKFCLLFKSSKHGIARLEVFDDPMNTTGPCQRIITLENCVKVTSFPPSHFCIVTKTLEEHLAVEAAQDLNTWVSCIQAVSFGENVIKPYTIEEVNDLYSPSGEGVFIVRLSPSEASNRCGLEADIYTLLISVSAIQLLKDNFVRATWPYMFIRRYGYRDNKFTFEAGRKCDTGEGVFHLEHSNQQEIFRCLSAKMKSMKKLLGSNDSVATRFEFSDKSFHQSSVSMEARSRSPLLTSSMESMRMFEMDLSSGVHTNKHTHLGNKGSLEIHNQNLDDSNDYKNYEPINISIDQGENIKDANSNYDQVEIRQEAWRTLGLNDVKHTENIADDKTELAEHVWLTKSQDSLHTEQYSQPPLASKIILSHSSENVDDSYDKLDFFGSVSKINRSNGYKKINPNSGKLINNAQANNTSYYDLVENIKTCRLADDSHQGYGMIRKVDVRMPTSNHIVPVPNVTKIMPEAEHQIERSESNSDIDHENFNGLQYALISKPKRV